MAWKKVDQALIDFLAEAVAPYPATLRKMFGCPAYFTGGNMFAAAHEDNLVLRLSPQHKEQLLAECDEAAPFDPLKGRPMREYVALPESVVSSGQVDFAAWLERSHTFAASLPPKEPKQAKRKK